MKEHIQRLEILTKELLASKEKIVDIEKKYRFVFESVLDPMLIIDDEGKIIDINISACYLYGYNSSEILGKNFDVLRDQEKHGNIDITAHDIINYHKKKSGESFPVNVSISLFNISGEKNILISVKDVSYRMDYEKKLTESEQRYRSLVETCPDGVAVIQNDKIVFVNSKAISMIGCGSIENCIDKKIDEFLIKKDIPATKQIMGKLSYDDKHSRFIARIRRADGSIFYSEFSIALIQWNGASAVQATFRNVTDSELAKQLLLKQCGVLDIISRNIESIIWIKDLHGNFMYINQSGAKKLFNTTPENIVGKNDQYVCSEYVKKYLGNEYYRQVQDIVFREGKTCRFYLIYPLDGGEFWIDLKETILTDENDEAIGTIAVALDITSDSNDIIDKIHNRIDNGVVQMIEAGHVYRINRI